MGQKREEEEQVDVALVPGVGEGGAIHMERWEEPCLGNPKEEESHLRNTAQSGAE